MSRCLHPASSNDAYNSKWQALKVNLKGKEMSAGLNVLAERCESVDTIIKHEKDFWMKHEHEVIIHTKKSEHESMFWTICSLVSH